MSDAEFVQAILANPDDDGLRLVYADWLDEQTSPEAAERAAILRLDVRLRSEPQHYCKTKEHLHWFRQQHPLTASWFEDLFGARRRSVDHPESCQVLELCPAAEEELWLQHANGFVLAFVIPAKRERWLDLLTRRPRRIGHNSHKLHSALDDRFCVRGDEFGPAGLRGDGVFYDFFGVPRVVPANLAVEAGRGRDAIFSLVPGELALYFFHECEVWVCRQVAPGR